MTKSFLTFFAMSLLVLGFATVPAWAEDDHATAAGQELVEHTEGMAADAEHEFDADVECADEAVDGEAPAEDCVSKHSADEADADEHADDAAAAAEPHE